MSSIGGFMEWSISEDGPDPAATVDTSPEAVQAWWEARAQEIADATRQPCTVLGPLGRIRAEPLEQVTFVESPDDTTDW